jgi:hypothetical protein
MRAREVLLALPDTEAWKLIAVRRFEIGQA